MLRVYICGDDADELFATVETQDQADRLIAALYHARNDGTEAELITGVAVPVVSPECEIELR